MFTLLHRRNDGSFVVERNGFPYHVTAGDPLYRDAQLAAEGVTLQPEPEAQAVDIPVPDISDRQFAHQLRDQGIISQAEALAFVKQGAVPVALETLIAALPTQAERDDAELLICGATTFQYAHPLTASLAAGFGWDVAQTIAFFRAAAAR